jgi:hypothetical protein
MAEEIQTPSTSPETSQTPNLVDRAEKLRDDVLAAEKRIDEKIKYNEEIETRRILGGKSNAGTEQKTPQQIQQESVNAEVESLLTGFNLKRK